MKIKVSVIVPTYNRAGLVFQAVQSVLDQSFHGYEVLIIDDGSSDNTRSALQSFQALQNIHYHFQENAGRSAARNLGIEKAKGEYLMFLDSDDLIMPTRLELLYNIAQENPESGVIGGRSLWVNEQGVLLKQQGNFRLKGNRYSENLHIEKIRSFFFSMGTYIIKKSLARNLGGFDINMHVGEDLDFFLRFCDNTKISFVDKPIAHIRRHESNTSEIVVTKAIRDIARDQLAFLEADKNQFSKDTNRRMRTEWQCRLAEDYYVLKENRKARRHYLEAIKIDPKLASDLATLKLVFMTFVPHKITEKLKSFFNRK